MATKCGPGKPDTPGVCVAPEGDRVVYGARYPSASALGYKDDRAACRLTCWARIVPPCWLWRAEPKLARNARWLGFLFSWELVQDAIEKEPDRQSKQKSVDSIQDAAVTWEQSS